MGRGYSWDILAENLASFFPGLETLRKVELKMVCLSRGSIEVGAPLSSARKMEHLSWEHLSVALREYKHLSAALREWEHLSVALRGSCN